MARTHTLARGTQFDSAAPLHQTRHNRDKDTFMSQTALRQGKSTIDEATASHEQHSPTESTRLEHDCIGSLDVPANAYWGIHTQRALSNFPVSGVAVSSHPELIGAYAVVKQACAMANRDLGGISHEQCTLITQACIDVRGGHFDAQFPIDVLQGGAGTSTNMNMNEVIANRALEVGGYARGDYDVIHPNDDVNKSQSTNDTYPCAIRLALISAFADAAHSAQLLSASFASLAKRTMTKVTLGRTQLQDAVPMTFGQEFTAFASLLDDDATTMRNQRAPLSTVNLGGTAIGTGICADVRFRQAAADYLAQLTNLPIALAPDPIAATSDTADFVTASGVIRNCAIHLGKIANDIRLLSSGPRAGLAEISIPAQQAGSSIMPGKINPVIAECVNQSVFTVIGLDATVCSAAQAGQLQLNAFEPVIAHSLLTGMHLLARAMDTLRTNCVEGMAVNAQRGLDEARRCASLATSLIGHVGYEKAAEIAKTALDCDISVHEAALRSGSIRAEVLDDILDPVKLARA
jgi:aspartate ammonia-lyase